MLIVVAASFDEPQQVVDGRGLLMFALPILAASVLLRPWASFVAAFACTLAIVVIGLVVVHQPMVNVPAILLFFMLALVSWLSARSLEHTMENLRAGNKLLQESEKRFKSYVENAPNGIFVTDEKGNYEVNKAAESITGYSRSELLKMNLIELVGTEDRPKAKEHFNTVVKTGKASGDFSFIKKDGSLNYWTVNTVKLSENRFLGFATDITERKRSEDALRESEQKYRSLFETMSEGFAHHQIVLDDQGKPIDFIFLNVNLSFERLTGLQSQDILGKRITKVLPRIKNDPTDWIETYGKVALNREPISFEQYSNSMNRWYSIFAYSPARLQFVTLFHDITERVQAEAEREQLLTQVQTQASLMRGIMDTVPEGVLLLDADGRIVLANPVSGQALAVLVGRDDISAHEPLTHLGDRSLAELLTSPPKGLWHDVKAGDRTFEIIARPMEPTADGRSENWVLVIRDVTQEREIERRIQQQERLAAVGQLAAGVAHDFNNIMATIVLYTRMSLNVPDLPPQIRQRLETVSGQAFRATDLVQQILDFSRRAVLERRPMDLTPFLKEVVNLLERTVPESIKMGLSYGSDEYTVNADPTRMQQAIVNLVVYARDAMPEGGELVIELERIQIESHQEPPLP
ncbi:MAG: PAS domain S-box protein, partial [Gammaproteobacteria bacterium]